MLDESEAFRRAYAAAVPERPKRRILKEAAAPSAQKKVYGASSPDFAEALKSVPRGLVELIYDQFKIKPEKLVELVEPGAHAYAGAPDADPESGAENPDADFD